MEADWNRERPDRFWDPSRRLLAAIRGYQRSRLLKPLWVLRHRFWSVVTGADIPINVKIGGGLLIPHPNGIVIHPEVVIGVNCLIMRGVTIGSNMAGKVPVIGNHVDIGPNAVVLGPISVGDHSQIGALSLVLHSLAERVVAYGIPARVMRVRKG